MADYFAKDVTMDGVLGRGENFFLALLAGLMASAVGAGVWMGVAVTAGSQLHVIPIGIMAIAVGALVGFAIRFAGNGRGLIFGILGAVLAFAGCVGGDVLTLAQQSTTANYDFMTALKAIDLALMFQQKDIWSWVGYAIGVYEGFVLSRRK